VKLYFVRHGESTANLKHEFSNTGRKHPLTRDGFAQARAVANSLCCLKVEKVYSSPVLRAVQTAKILSERVQAPLEITPALQEWDVGVYEGTSDPAGWELHRQVQDDWFIHNKFDSKMPGGESYNEILGRFVPFIEKLGQDDRNSNYTYIMVAHGGLYLAMLPAIFKNVDYAFARQHGFPYAACAVAESRLDGLWCTSWCGISLMNML